MVPLHREGPRQQRVWIAAGLVCVSVVSLAFYVYLKYARGESQGQPEPPDLSGRVTLRAKCAVASGRKLAADSVTIACGLDKAEIEAVVRQAVGEFDLTTLVEQVRKREVRDPAAIDALGAMLGLTREAVTRLLEKLGETELPSGALIGRLAEVVGRDAEIIREAPPPDPAPQDEANTPAKRPPESDTPEAPAQQKAEEATPAGQQRVLNDAEVVQAECAAVARGELAIGQVELRCGADQADIKAIVARVVSEFDLPSVLRQLREGAAGDDPLIQALAKDLPLTHASILRLLAMLAATDVPSERAAEELATLAQHHIRLVWQIGRLRSAAPQVGALRDQAAAAVARGDYPRAEELLAKAEAERRVAQGVTPEAQHARPKHRSQRDEYEDLRSFTEVLSLLQSNHVDGINLRDVIYGAIRGLLRVGDPIGAFLPPDLYQEMQGNEPQGAAGVGLELTMRDEQLTIVTPLDGTPAVRGGLRMGDRILQIDGQPTAGMPLLEARRKLWGPAGTPVILTIWRQDLSELLEIHLVRERIAIANITFRELSDGVAHIRMRHFNQGAAQELQKTLADPARQRTTALVLDLRNNPGGLLQEAVDVAGLFLEKGQRVVETRGRVANQNQQFVAKGQKIWQGPVTVLVNEGSAGSSEIVAGALQEWKRAVIVGVPTFGLGFVHTIIPLSDGSGLKLTTARYFTPQGRSIQGRGVVPDLMVDQAKPLDDTNLPGELRQDSSGSGETRRVSPRADMQLDKAVEALRSRGL